MFSFFKRRPWAIHNPLKSWTLAGISLRECQILVASMTDAEMKVSWVYHEKWQDWMPLTAPECHDLFLFKDSDQAVLPALPQITQEDDHEITEVRMVSGAAKIQGPAQRKHPRFVAKIPVEIMVSTYSFATHTVDLSAGGFCFEDKLPEWVAGYFTVALNTPEGVFELTCFLAEDQKKDKFRAEIAPITPGKILEDYRKWISVQKFPDVPKK